METKFDFDFAVNVPPEYQPRTERESRQLHEFSLSKEMVATYTYLKRVEVSYLIESIHRARDVKNWALNMRFNLERRGFPVPPDKIPSIYNYARTICIGAHEMERELRSIIDPADPQWIQQRPDNTAEASADFGGPSVSPEQEHPAGERPSSDQATPPTSQT